MSYTLYGPTSSSDKRTPMEAVTSSETPGRVVLVVGQRVVESESSFCDVQLKKLATYNVKSTKTIRGLVYDFVDFVVRVGLLFTKNNEPSGVAVEIEYAPCSVVDDCAGLIGELMGRIAASLVPPPQAGNETMAAKAATMSFNFSPVAVDYKKYFANDKPFFTARHAMLLYRKLLAEGEAQ